MIEINKIIYDVLSNDTELNQMVNGNIFILKIPEEDVNGNEINKPIIQFGRVINPDYNKSSVIDNVSLILNIYSNTYTEGINISKRVRTLLEYLKGKDDESNLVVRSIYIDSISEDYDFENDTYIQKFNFKIK